MKIYISGKITGLPMAEVKVKFDKAKEYLTSLGYEVVSPLNNYLWDSGRQDEATWEEHMVADIVLLLPCDAIYMLPDWLSSKGAMIEKSIAQIIGMKIFHESRMEEDSKAVEKIEMILFRVEAAIQEVTGLALIDYAVVSRAREKYFARLMFAYHCQKLGLKNKSLIGRCLNKDHATPIRAMKKYPDERKYNPEFRKQADQVNAILTQVLVLSQASCL